jgi:hypothetical protein
MDGQLTFQYTLQNGTSSLHFTQAPQSSIVQLGLAGRYDLDEWAVPVADAIGAFTTMTTKDGGTTDLLDTGLVFDLVANDLTELEGLLIADNCTADYMINFFYWPSVFTS